MKSKPTLLLSILFAWMLALFLSPATQAGAEWTLAQVDPKEQPPLVYHSFKHKLLILGLPQSKKASFDCSPNRYFFYYYGSDYLRMIEAGSLRLNPDFSRAFFGRILSVGAVSGKRDRARWKGEVEAIMAKLGVSALVLEMGKMVAKNGRQACWQQPVVLNLKNDQQKKLELPLANLCKTHWCQDIHWPNQDHVRFWVRVEPKLLHLLEWDVKQGGTRLIKKEALFLKPKAKPVVAPRENLFDSSRALPWRINLVKRGKQRVFFGIEAIRGGRLRLYLSRSQPNPVAAQRVRLDVQGLNRQKKLIHALKLIDYALWLDPNNPQLRFEKVRAQLAAGRIDDAFDLLAKDFPPAQRVRACQMFHLEKTVRFLWKRPKFAQRFREVCP